MRRLHWFVILLGLLAAGLGVELAPRAGAAGPENSPNAAQRESVCPALGVELLMDRSGLREGTAPGELPEDEKPLRFDCGIGETWRHHVP